jgi:polyvinyl alcohol dehydrogenase (cytochrome)
MKFRYGFIIILWLLATSCDQQSATEVADSAPAAEDAVEKVHPGEAPYLDKCGSCHDGMVYKAPHRMFLAMMAPDAILASMVSGTMAELSTSMTEKEMRDVAEFIAGRSLDDLAVEFPPPVCDESSVFDATKKPTAKGWGVDLRGSRYQPAETGGLTVADVPYLEVKWSFAYPNAYQARSQPAVAAGAVFVGSQDGTVYSLDAKTGCVRWTYRATAEVRTGIVVSDWEEGDAASARVYFGDILARAYSLDAKTGELQWLTKVDPHPNATITGTPTLVGDRLFVPVSSLEVVNAVDPNYKCCTFRGAIVALDTATGEQIWKNYTVDEEPKEIGKNSAGVPIMAPSGAPIWNSPIVDLERKLVYAGSGENYTSPADSNSDAIIAFSMEDGKKVWVAQQTTGDAWNVACLTDYTVDDANCPEEKGPDYDFGGSPILITLEDGSDIVVGGQKSGNAMGIDPDTGQTVWKTQVGRGGVQGGILFGMASEGQKVYVGVSDMYYPEDESGYYTYDGDPRPGMYAVDAATGAILWSSPAPDVCEADNREFCDPGIGQAVTAIPGAVIAGHFDGHLRIYNGADGKVLMDLNTLVGFDTVSGERAKGGSFSGGGPAVADGMIYVNSGYGMYFHMPGNVLLALGPAGK